MRTDMSQLIVRIQKENLFSLWRNIALGTAKQNKEDAEEYQNIKIPDHKTAVCIQASKSIKLNNFIQLIILQVPKFQEFEWTKQTKKRIMTQYYEKGKAPSESELTEYRELLTTEISMYAGNRTQIMGDAFTINDWNKRLKKVQSPFKPIHEMEGVDENLPDVRNKMKHVGKGSSSLFPLLFSSHKLFLQVMVNGYTSTHPIITLLIPMTTSTPMTQNPMYAKKQPFEMFFWAA